MLARLALLSLALQSGAPDCAAGPETVDSIRAERIVGSLSAAESRARRLLACRELDPTVELGLQLELAKILDRLGLHHNTRPVEEASSILRLAEATIDRRDKANLARITLAIAELHYRAEIAGSRFTEATEHAERAIVLFREAGDAVGVADAVHLLGLVALQRRDFDEARARFDESLEFSAAGPRRPIFLSDYHRHVGMIELQSDEPKAAIPHFEKSLAYRDEAGSRDYGLFARTMLASALIDDGRAAEARGYLEEALRFASELPSPVGEMQATFHLAEMHEALSAPEAALAAYRRAASLAGELGAAGLLRRAEERATRLETGAARPRG